MTPHGHLIARGDELSTIDRFLNGPPDELPAALLLEGEAGIGKTALWRETVTRSRAAGGTVLESALTVGEARLAFAGLADLVEDVWHDVAAELAPPQRAALEQALLLREGAAALPDERAVAFGFLGLVRALVRSSPVTIAIDDIQWLDPSSTAMLSYMLRRLRAEQVRFVLARRVEDGTDPDPLRLERAEHVSVEPIAIGPLTLGALHHLLRRRLGSPLSRPALSRIHTASHGNPLHALELVRALDSPLDDDRGSLTSLMRARINTLPRETREALLLASLSATPSLATLTAAGVDAPDAAFAPAVATDLVTLQAGTVRFAHPLLASAAVETCDEVEVRQAHRRLADAAATDEERARHLGGAANGPDEEIASVVELAADGARRRGATTASAELYYDAAILTPPSEAREAGRRLVEAGRAFFEAGDTERARALFQTVVDAQPEGDARVEARWRLGGILDETGDPDDAVRLWREALAATDDARLTAEIERSLAVTMLYTASTGVAAASAATAVAAAERSGDATTLAYALGTQALIGVMRGSPGFQEPLAQSLLIDDNLDNILLEWSPTAVKAECGRLTGRIDVTRDAYEAVLSNAAASGDVGNELWAAFGLSSTELLAGNMGRARELADQVLELAEQTRLMRIPAAVHAANVAAHEGELDIARTSVLAALADSRAANEHVYELNALHGLGFIEASRGDHVSASVAYAQAREVAQEFGIGHTTVLRAVLLEAEAAAESGLVDQAETALIAYRGLVTPAFEPSWLASVALRAAAAVANANGELVTARELLETARVDADTTVPLEAARTQLAYGSLLRRQREHAAARAELEAALAMFERLGATAWTRRTTEEIARIPGRTTRRHDELTDAEQLIAAHVARGQSNKEVAAALHLSVKTVEVTLTRVYRKVGVRSRTELAARFGSESII